MMADYRENVLPVLHQSLISDNISDTVCSELIEISQHHQLFGVQKSSALQAVLKSVHQRINTSRHRLQGIVLLGQIVRQCNTDVFVSNAQTWLHMLIKILQTVRVVPVLQATCHLCGDIIGHSKNFAELSREITGSIIPQLLPLLIEAQSTWRGSALSCINTCICTFSGAVGPFKAKIENAVLSEFEKTDVSPEAIRCYALLSRCGGSGNLGVKYTEGWTRQCKRLLSSLHHTLCDLYEGLETEVNAFTSAQLPLPAVNSTGSERVAVLVSRWRFLSDCMIFLLRERFPAVAKVPIDAILQLVTRCLAVNNNMLLSRPTTERTFLAAYLPAIHISALHCLQQLIVSCRSLLLPQCGLINSLLTQELLWTSMTEACGCDKPFSELRICVYEVLAAWLKVLDTSSCVHLEEKVLIKQIVLDASPQAIVLKLDKGVTTSSTEGPPSKKRKTGAGGYQEITQGISSQRKSNPYANRELSGAALEALYWVVTTCGSELSSRCLQEVQKFTVGTLLSLRQSGDSMLTAPYSSAICRRSLYRVLQACVLVPHPQAPPPLQCAIAVFIAGKRDTSAEVSSFCIEAARVCETLMHPRVPCLNGPIICQSPVIIGTQLNGLVTGQTDGIENQSTAELLYQSSKTAEKQTNKTSDIQKANLNSDSNGKESEGDIKNPESEGMITIESLSASDSSSGVSDVDEKFNKQRNDSAGDVEMKESNISGTEPTPGSSKMNMDAILIMSDEENVSDDNSDRDDVVENEGDVQEIDEELPAVVGDKMNSEIINLERCETVDSVTVVDSNSSEKVTTGNTENDGSPTIEVSSDEELEEEDDISVIESRKHKDENSKSADKEVEAMLLTFVDADPDSE